MRIAVFSTHRYDEQFLDRANKRHGHGHVLVYFESRLKEKTAPLAAEYEAVCAFVNDRLNPAVLNVLAAGKTKLIALRCAGFNHVDLEEADRLGLTVVRVPAYSPHAVAEHTVALMLSLNRRVHRAHNRVREGNFLLEGLLGFDMHGKTAGIIGTGQIGQVVAQNLAGFGCKLLGYDVQPNDACLALGMEYVDLPTLYRRSDMITLHCPLTPDTHHLVNAESIAQMKQGVMLINTSRGGLVHTPDVIEGLKSRRVGYLGLDVYEEESAFFYKDLSNVVIQDDHLARLLTFPNVLITAHQGYFTDTALTNIAETTLQNVTDFEQGGELVNRVTRK